MMNFNGFVFEENTRPKYIQLFDYMKDEILKNKENKDAKLPSIRQLATLLKVNNATVIATYKQLEKSGYIYAKKGSGYYITTLKEPKGASSYADPYAKDFIHFTSATPHPAIFPMEPFKECMSQVVERDGGYVFGYQDSSGYKPLRESLANYIQKASGIGCIDPSFLQLVAGAQQGLDLIGKVLLHPGDYVITELPTYQGAVESFESRGAHIVSVSLMQDGMDLVELEKKIRICRPKLVYMMTHYQNPTSISYSLEKRMYLVALAKEYGFYIVEDDSMSELGFEEADQKALKAFDKYDQVIYLKSFSKLLMPGFRIGVLALPPVLKDAFTKVKETTDITSLGLTQRALDLYFRQGNWQRHFTYMHAHYEEKYFLMKKYLTKWADLGARFYPTKGGLYFWIELPGDISSQAFTKEALSNGVKVMNSSPFYLHKHLKQDRFIRLSFAMPTKQEIREGMKILTDILKRNLN
jgi:DNA-binding transcriptional MocR family regulator